MPASISLLLLLLFLSVTGYGLYASAMGFFVAGAVGFLAILVNVLVPSPVAKDTALVVAFGEIIYTAYLTANLYF